MSKAQSFQEVVTKQVKFKIPEYQRNYSWTEEEFQDLWRDLNNVMDNREAEGNGRNHFYGMFLFETEDNVYKIIDGQQRITTAIIFLNEIKNKLAEQGYDTEAEKIKQGYIKDINGYKLQLGTDEDDLVLKDNILGKKVVDRDIEVISDSPSQNKLLRAKKFFREKLEDKDKEYLLDLKEEITKLEVLTYEVESIIRAVKIFETANDRGRDLTVLDKTKSFLMLQIYLNNHEGEETAIKEEINLLQSRFGDIYGKIEEINQDSHWGDLSEDNIQRFHYILWDTEWSSSRGERYHQNLLENLKQKIRESETPLEDIENYSKQLKTAFVAQEQLTKKSEDSREKYLIKRMELMGSMGNIRPLLLALRLKKDSLGEDNYIEILELVETLAVRMYSILQRPAYTARYKIYNLARDVYQENVSVEEIKEKLIDIIEDKASDEAVREALTEEYDDFYKDFGKQEIRFLLYFYEEHKQTESDRQKMPFNLEEWVNGKLVGADKDTNIEVEHIHPQSPNEDLDLEEDKHRLGNLSILPEGENKSLQNAVQADKEEAYKHVNLDMNKDIVPDLTDWGKDTIENREEEIVNHILERWSY